MGANPTRMGIKRALSDYRELRQSVVELFDDDRSAEAEASLRITRSAQRFSRNTKEVVDDKLSFSATLMRAGEVDAANRLLAEVHHEVREEEAALIESVNEVKVAQSLRRERVTRLRLARMLAVAVVGSAVLSFSAAGMAVAGFLRDRAEAIARPNDEGATRLAAATTKQGRDLEQDRKLGMRRLRIGQVDVLLTKSQFERLRELTGGGSSSLAELEELLTVLPGPLANQIQEAITVAEGEVAAAETEVESTVAQVEKSVIKKKRAAKRAAEDAEQQEAPADEEPTPKPTPTNDGEDDGSQSENGDSPEDENGDSESEKEQGDAGPPLPIRP